MTRPASGETTTRSSSPRSLEVLGQHEHRGHVVDRDLEEALDLAGVEIHREHAVGPGRLEHPRHQPRADRLARGRLLVLARVAVPGRYGDDAVGRGADGGVDHHHQLHQRVVGGHPGCLVAAGRLHEEDVGAADRLLEPAVDLAVGEGLERHRAEIDAEPVGDLRRQLGMGAAGERPSAACRNRSGCW